MQFENNVPAAESGTVYATLDERCMACKIQGGDESPCLAPHDLAAHELDTGHPCPRREPRDIDDPLTAQLAVLGARPETGHLFRALFDTALERFGQAERLRLLRRISRAYRDPVVSACLWPPRPAPADFEPEGM